ncbi:MAG: hypothetical protein RLZZ387_1335 [Chloroflexota bacterium]|jgi:uncharacterized membrane protein YoaK (UPF0700 family)
MLSVLTVVAQAEGEAAGAGFGGLLGVVVAVVVIAGMWKLFTKAGKPGWAAIVPIYNTIVLLQIAGKPWWWILGLVIPVVNIVVAVLALHSLSKRFGHGVGFTLGLIFLAPVFVLILGFGDSQYRAPALSPG